MEGLITPPLVVEQQVNLFGVECTLRVEAGLEGSASRTRVFIGEHTDFIGDELLSAHLPAQVERGFLDALYAVFLTLPVMDIGQALHARGRV